MTAARIVALVLAVGPLLDGHLEAASLPRRPEPLPRSARLEGGAPSVEVLVDQLLAALATADRRALERLRVTEKEYLEIIVPGNVEPGQPPQRIPDDVARYYWATLDAKSRYSAQHLLHELGGRPLKVKRIAYAKGEKRYAWFMAFRQLRVTVEDNRGNERDLGTGSVASVRGRYKFVSFVRD
jgi:hypothetical protein